MSTQYVLSHGKRIQNHESPRKDRWSGHVVFDRVRPTILAHHYISRTRLATANDIYLPP